MKTWRTMSLATVFCLCAMAVGASSGKLKKLIIDTDAGGDDAAAILLALGFEKNSEKSSFQVIAITCTYGNTNVTNVATNVLKILTIAHRSDIPVYVGAHKSLLKTYTQGNYFGEDGFGDFHFDEKIDARLNETSHASVAMVDLARKYPGEVSVMAIGPLTNVAIAMTLDSSFVNNIERFYVLGSSVRGRGNVAPNVEFNFGEDPHSNFIVLNGTDKRTVFLFPWEANLDAAISMEYIKLTQRIACSCFFFNSLMIDHAKKNDVLDPKIEDLAASNINVMHDSLTHQEWRKDVLGALDSRTMIYLNKIERTTLDDPVWNVADLALSALVLRPDLVTTTLITNVTPVYDGMAEGSVLVDYSNATSKSQNVEILQSFDVPRFKDLLLEIFSRE